MVKKQNIIFIIVVDVGNSSAYFNMMSVLFFSLLFNVMGMQTVVVVIAIIIFLIIVVVRLSLEWLTIDLFFIEREEQGLL